MARLSVEPSISIECVDNAEGFPAVIVYDNFTIPLSQSQDNDSMVLTFSVGEQGRYSSVQPFMSDDDDEYDADDDGNGEDCDPLETDRDSPESIVLEWEEDKDEEDDKMLLHTPAFIN